MITENTTPTIAVIVLATIPMPVGPVLLVQKPHKLRITKIQNACLFEYKL